MRALSWFYRLLAAGLLVFWVIWGACHAAVTATDSSLWTFNHDASVSGTLVATAMPYGVQLWSTSTFALQDDYYVGEGEAGARCALMGGKLAFSRDDGAVLLLDAGTPSNLTLASTVYSAGTSPVLALRDEGASDWLYAADTAGELHTWDVSTMSAAVEADSLVLYDGAVDACFIDANTVAIATDVGFETITVSTHSAIVRADSVRYVGSGYVRAIDSAGGVIALSLSSDGVWLYNASGLGFAGSFDLDAGTYTDATARGVAFSSTGDSLMVLGDDVGVTVWDVSTPSAAVLVGHDPALDTGGSIAASAYFGEWHGDNGYAALWGHSKAGVYVADVTAAGCTQVDRCEAYDYSRDITASAGVVYSCNGDQGVVAVSGSPGALVPRGRYELVATWGAAASGTDVFMAASTGGARFAAIDFSDLDAPVLADSLGYVCRDVSLSGGHAYVAGYTLGLYSADVSTPSALIWEDREEHGTSETWGVSTASGICVTADGPDGLNVWDVSNPDALAHLGNLTFAGDALDVAITPGGRGAYVAVEGVGVSVVDLHDPEAPEALTTFGSTEVRGVDLFRGVLAVSAWGDGVSWWVAGALPAAPWLIDSYDTVGHAYRTASAIVGGRYYTYVADREGILEVRLDVDAGAFCNAPN